LIADARAELRRYVSHPRTRSSLTAYARRWGLADGAEDVVQTVLCDALAVQAVPVPVPDIPRWVSGIARKKIADERRRRARWQWVEWVEPKDAPATASPEAADLLQRIEREVVDPEQRRALGWLLREHAGDSLLEIAREQAMQAPALRQRIHRLRQRLRARYLAPLLVLLLGIGATAAWSAHSRQHAAAAVAPAALARYDGQWRVARSEPSRYAALGLRVVIAGGTVRVQGPTGLVERELSVAELAGDRVTLRSGDRTWHAVLAAPDADHLKLSGDSGAVELVRER
jgi:DNA-directed RNA polymerase specialized sigma24 family protein